jgi:integrase/recombinase XerD
MEANVDAFLTKIESKPAYSDSTRLAYASDLRGFIQYLKKTLNHSPKLTDLSTKQVAGYLQAEVDAGRRHSTLVRRLATIRQFEKHLKQQGILKEDVINQNPDLISHVISQAPEDHDPKLLSEKQISRLQEIFETSNRHRARRDQAILFILLETGLSVADLVELNLTDLDLRARRLHIVRNKDDDKWLPLGKATDIVARYLREGRPEFNPQPNEPALFVSQMGRRMSRQGIWQILNYWGNLTDPPVKISPRKVRHTAALRMAHAGCSLEEIQTLLGHSNPLSTQALLRRLQTRVSKSNYRAK